MIKRMIPLAAMEKIIKKAGDVRVSDKAKVALKEVLESRAEQIAERAWRLAEHAGRKTVKKEDITLSFKMTQYKISTPSETEPFSSAGIAKSNVSYVAVSMTFAVSPCTDRT